MQAALLIITVTLTLSFAVSQLFKRYELPEVLAQVFVGFVLGIPFLKAIFFKDMTIVDLLSELGIIFLLLLTGMEVDYKKLIKEKKEILLITIFGFLIPFAFGFGLMVLLGYSFIIATIVGFALSLTSEGLKLKLLMDYGEEKSRLGQIMIGASIADDTFEIIGLAFVIIMATGFSVIKLIKFPLEIIAFIAVILIIIKILPKVILSIKATNEQEEFTLMLIIGLATSLASFLLEIGPIIGAFLGGLIIHKILGSGYQEKKMLKDLKMVSFGFLVPFFFIRIGLNFDYSSVITNIWLFLVILICAIAGKLIGSLAVMLFTKISFNQAMLIGWSMNARGSIELVIISIARLNNLIPEEIFSSIVMMTIVTTAMLPFIFRVYLRKYPDILH